ncbi:hypothetical protein AMPH_13225 [Acinetobacter baumannii]|nr:hypothetical protein AMPH_13225 [Acinetobacter baumannii]SSQ11557.1 Uncharacterised protein [Acinetobacter baumannii]SSR16973.1 Uncharacterised protein [Acinetobacter nosocomialis]
MTEALPVNALSDCLLALPVTKLVVWVCAQS